MSFLGYAASLAVLFGPPVRHEPLAPKPDQPVTVTARLPSGTTKAILKLQDVAPGAYLRKADPDYEKNWIELPMTAGTNGTFTIKVPGNHQQHRHLLRYRIVASDAAGKTSQLPVANDPCPNFAWWCDAGPAAWTGSRDPGRIPAVTYSSEFLGTMQSLHLLAKAEDVAKSQWDSNFHRQKQQGTLVYRGVVFDHIQYSNRGQGSAHISGKNKWGLKFNAGHALPLRDHDGLPFPDLCRSLNLNPGGSTPYLPILRGITGLDEVLSMRSFRLASVPAPPATWIQWRVVTTAEEVNAKSQYKGDLWGVYVAIGEMEPELLADRGLEDGLTVSIQSGVKHTPPGMAEPQKEWEKFLNGMRSNPKEEWWRQNLDLPAYYSFHALNRLLGNVDIRPDGNHGYYRRPDGHWAPIPWDLDMMFIPRHHQPGIIDAHACLKHPAIALEYRNRAREILDLFAGDATERGGQVGQLAVDLSAALISQDPKIDWPHLDEAVWNQNPRMNQKGSWFVNPTRGDYGGGSFNRILATTDFAGFRKFVVDFCTDSRASHKYAPNDGDARGYGWGYLAFEAKDDKIPATPTVERLPGEGYRLRSSAFTSPSGSKPATLEWRAAKINEKGKYELDASWWKALKMGTETDVPAIIFAAKGEYRVRARWRDDTGRCSHWSGAVTVVVK